MRTVRWMSVLIIAHINESLAPGRVIAEIYADNDEDSDAAVFEFSATSVQ
jgi:hypothetical protein